MKKIILACLLVLLTFGSVDAQDLYNKKGQSMDLTGRGTLKVDSEQVGTAGPTLSTTEVSLVGLTSPTVLQINGRQLTNTITPGGNLTCALPSMLGQIVRFSVPLYPSATYVAFTVEALLTAGSLVYLDGAAVTTGHSVYVQTPAAGNIISFVFSPGAGANGTLNVYSNCAVVN